jgi:hypothetical protein
MLGELDCLGMSQQPEIAGGPQTARPDDGGIQLGNFAIHRADELQI